MKVAYRVHPTWTALALCFSTLLTPGTAQGQTTYGIEPIVMQGETVADVTLRADGGYVLVGRLNDNGQIALVTANAEIRNSDMLLQYAGGKFIPIAVGGREAPGGTWARGQILSPVVSMNQLGNIAFYANATIGGTTGYGTFLWDAKTQKVTTLAFKGMPAVNGLVFEKGSIANRDNHATPIINNRGEIAFSAGVKNSAGGTRSGVFFRGGDGQLQAVALPDDVLPGGEKMTDGYVQYLNEAGRVIFWTLKTSYIWEKGAISRVSMPAIGMDVPGGKIGAIHWRSVNDQDENGPLLLSLQGSRKHGLYLYENGSVTSLVPPGHEMPGGGKLAYVGEGAGNNVGQIAFKCQLEDGTWAVYLVEPKPGGKLSLVLKTGATTELGKITSVGGHSPGMGLNNKGQIAVAVQIDGGPDMIVLLTPTTP
jgi:hypothetical protein